MMKYINSSLNSHAFNPTRIRPPAREHSLKALQRADDENSGFESVQAALQEDRTRARMLIADGTEQALTLGEELQKACDHDYILKSCASSRYMRQLRLRAIGELHSLVAEDKEASEQAISFTLNHPNWIVAADDLAEFDVQKLKAQLRRYFERSGITAANGFLFAGLHGEFDGTCFHLHYHGIATGRKGKCLTNLKGKYGFVTSAKSAYRTIKIVPLPSRPSKKKLAGWLSYCLQSYWPHHKRWVDSNGKSQRSKVRMRIPKSHQANYLLFLARHSFSDLTFLNGLKIGKGGLCRLD